MKRSLSIAIMIAVLGAWVLTAEAGGPLTPIPSASRLLDSRAHNLVLDIAGPAGPNFAYVATDRGLEVVDITQPTAPVVKGKVALGGISLGLDVDRDKKLVFVANVKTGLRVVDVSNPDQPVVVGTRTIPGSGGARDAAIKGDIVYVASWPGELFVIRYKRITQAPPKPPVVTLTPVMTLGLPAWGPTNGNDAAFLAKLNNYLPSGSAKISSVSITGDMLITLDFAYGHLYFYQVGPLGVDPVGAPTAAPDNPIFVGAHGAPFMFLALIDSTALTNPAAAVAYGFAASSGKSGVYSLPLDLLGPGHSTRFDHCGADGDCGYFKSPATDFAGLGISDSGRYVIFLGGKQGVIQVVNVTDPANMFAEPNSSQPIVGHGMRLAETMGAQTTSQIPGDYIFTTEGNRGFRVYQYDGLNAANP